MNKEYIIQLLDYALNPKGELRTEAEKNLKQLIQTDFQSTMILFIEIIVDLKLPMTTRNICSIIAKNCVHSKNARIQKSYEEIWMSCSFDFKMLLLKILQSHLNFKERNILQNIAKILGSLIRIELMHNSEISFFDTLFEMLSLEEYSVGVLETVSCAYYQLFEETNYNFDNFPLNNMKIFKIGTFMLGKENVDREIKIASLKCILNTIDLYVDVISLPVDRLGFLTNISKIDIKDEEILDLSLDILNRFFDCFIDHRVEDVEFICNFYDNLFDTVNEMPLQYFEFWTNLYESNVYYYMKKYFNTLIKKLILCIKKENIQDTEASAHKSACCLLILLRKGHLLSWDFDNELQQFISQKFLSKNREDNAIGCTALGCIYNSKGFEFLISYQNYLISFLDLPEVANEALFAISKIVEWGDYNNEEMLFEIINKCLALIQKNEDSVYISICTLHTIIHYIKKNTENSFIFQNHYTPIISSLVQKLETLQADEYQLRNIVNVTISELLTACPPCYIQLIDHFETYIYKKIIQIIGVLRNSSYDQALALDDSLCGSIILLECCLSMKKTFDVKYLCNVFVEVLLLPEIMARGEVYIAMSKLLCHFSIHLKKFMPFILRDIKSKEVFVLKAAINLLSECALFLESAFIEFISVVTPALLSAISSQDVPLDIKPSVISSIGDIALAVGKGFSAYLGLCTILFTQINSVTREGDEEFVDDLRKSVIKLFSCLFVSVGFTQDMRKEMPEIVKNIREAIRMDVEHAYRLEIIELIGDIVRLDASIKENFDLAELSNYLREAMRSKKEQENIKAKEVLDRII